MRATEANTKLEIEILGPRLMYCCWLESLVRFCVCSLCFAENMNDFRRKTHFEIKLKNKKHSKHRKFPIIDSSYVSHPL